MIRKERNYSPKELQDLWPAGAREPRWDGILKGLDPRSHGREG